MSGYFEIGIFHPKTCDNVGTLWRSAYQLGASGIFTIGARYKKMASDTYKTSMWIPLRAYDTIEQFIECRPHGALLVGVEMGGEKLAQFNHPPRAIYLLGAEDHGLPLRVLSMCNYVVSLESVRSASYNVAVAGSLVMYNRQFKG